MKYILLLILFVYSVILWSQNTLLNEAKYWVWRDRLVNDFMVPNYTGDYAHKGRGIVINKRGTDSYWPTIDSSSYVYSGGFDINDEGFQIGKYLIVLATEWRLLFNSGLPTEQTEAEIFWELKTIDRLDYDAETYWSYFWSRGQEVWGGQRDGFMIRDDVFTNFLWYNDNYPTLSNHIDDAYFHFYKTYYFDTVPTYIKFNQDAYVNYRYLNQGNDGNRGKYIKQNIMLCKGWGWGNNPDSLYITGIFDLRELMKKIRNTHHLNGHFIEFNDEFPYIHITEPYGINEYYYPDNGGFSAAMAGLYACYDDFQGGAHYNRQDFRDHYWTGPEEYSLDNYIGLLQGLVAVEQLVNSDVNVNGNGLASYARQQIKRIIESIKNNQSFNDNWVIDNPVTDLCVKGVFWEKIIDNVLDGDHYFYLNYACNQGGAQAGSYSGQFAKIYKNYVGENLNGQWFNGVIGGDNALLSAILVTLSGTFGGLQTEDLKKINKKCCKDWIDHDASEANKNEFQYLDLLFCYLHGLDEPERGYQHYYDILNTTICPDNQRVGNLLSEMIIHNLLKILKGEKYQYSIFDNNTYPSATTLCTQSQVTFGSIESEATVTQSPTSGCKANVTYKAGKEIHLKPGFKVINGAKFHGYIEQMDVCQIKEGNPEVAVLFFPPSSEQLSPYVLNLNYTKEEIIENSNEPRETVLNNTILLYPNPAKEILTLQSEKSVSYSVEIYDTMGQLIERDNVNVNGNITVSHLKRGIYIFKIFNQNELVQIQKIVLQ